MQLTIRDWIRELVMVYSRGTLIMLWPNIGRPIIGAK